MVIVSNDVVMQIDILAIVKTVPFFSFVLNLLTRCCYLVLDEYSGLEMYMYHSRL